jgi:hypothetical protein
MQDIIPNYWLWCLKDSLLWKVDIDIYVITEGNKANVQLCGAHKHILLECRLPPHQKNANFYLDWPRLKVHSVMYLETQLLKHKRKLNTALLHCGT